jgi:hypothetical protein
MACTDMYKLYGQLICSFKQLGRRRLLTRAREGKASNYGLGELDCQSISKCHTYDHASPQLKFFNFFDFCLFWK